MNLQVEQLHPLVLSVGRDVHHADWNWKNVSRPFTRLYYVTEGMAKIELPDGVPVLVPGHMYFIPAFTAHTTICDSPFVHYYIPIYEECYSDEDWLDKLDVPLEVPLAVQTGELEPLLFKRLCEINPTMGLEKSAPTTYDNNPTLMRNLLMNKQRAFYGKIESRGIVFQLLSHFFKQAQHKVEIKDKRIGKAISYIRKHIYESIDLNLLAEKSGLSKDHFIR